MTINRSDGLIVFVCDACGDRFDTGQDSWMDAWHEAKEAGWSARQEDNGSWTHVCAGCPWPSIE